MFKNVCYVSLHMKTWGKLWKWDYGWHTGLIAREKRAFLNEWGSWEISSFITLSHITRHLDHFPNTQATGDSVFCTPCAHMWVSIWVCVHAVQWAIPQDLPVLCVFAGKPIRSLKYCFHSVIISHLVVHYLWFAKMELLAREMSWLCFDCSCSGTC